MTAAANAAWAHLPYHRLAHVTPSSGRWWRPLVMLLVFTVTFLVLALVGGLAFWGLSTVFPEIPRPTEMSDDPTNPSDVALGFGVIALLVPCTWVTMRVASGRFGTISSVFGVFRWRFMMRALAVVLPLYVVCNTLGFVVDRPSDLSAPALDARLMFVLVTAVVVVPLQAAGEEYVFRGLIPQMLGTWLRSGVWGALVSVPLFVLGHGYDAWGLVDIATFALCATYLTWKSGGLELAIVMHVANNLTLMLLAPFSPSSLHQGAVAPASLLVSVPVTLAVTAGLSGYASRTYGLGRLQPLVRPRETTAI